MEIHRIQCGNANCYAIASASGSFLVDTGRPGDLENIEQQLRAKGVEPERLKLVIITHGHQDHAGGAGALKKKYRVPLAMAEGEGENRPMSTRGITGRLLLSVSKKALRQTLTWRPDIALRDGQKLHEFGLPGRIVALPGHTRGSVGLLLEGGKLLLAGDMYMNFAGPSLAHIFEDERALLESHRKLSGYPIRTVYPGHGKAFLFSDLHVK